MPVPNEWEEFRRQYATKAIARGQAHLVPQRYGGTAEELYCWPAIGTTFAALGEAQSIEIMEEVWGTSNAAGLHRVVASIREHFARLAAGDKLTRREAKNAWRAMTLKPGRNREDAEAAVIWGLSEMLVEE